MTSYVDSKGAPVRLGHKIAQGGEGAVFAIEQNPNLVAKVYLSDPSERRQQKIRAMVGQQSDQLLKLTAWPKDLLLEQGTNHVKGFLMSNAGRLKAVHQLYSPRSRSVEFESADWRFLIQAGTNIARAFATIHQAGHVIGDVNHSSVFVAQDATVKLIDCDSFQISQGGSQYICEVGEPFHTPPELQGSRFSQVVRTANHDNFGLAVLIFELLFMGRHPFAGAYLGSGELSLEQKIAGFKFAYGPGAAGRQMRPPPNTLDFKSVSEPVCVLFEQAFGQKGAAPNGRPSAAQWIEALVKLQTKTEACSGVGSHYYLKGLKSCPWCAIEGRTGVSLFTVPFVGVQLPGGFDLALAWDQICRVPVPTSAPRISFRSNALPPPQPNFLMANAGRMRNRIGNFIFSVLLLGTLTWFLGAIGLAASIICIPFIPIMTGRKLKGYRKRAVKEVAAAERQLEHLKEEWKLRAGPKLFADKLKELEQFRVQHKELRRVRQQRHQQLLNTVDQRQRERFLDGNRILPGVVKGIGWGRCRTLQSYGIETALDVDTARIMGIDGFGPTRTADLLAWRAKLEKSFVAKPGAGVHPEDLKKLDAEMVALKATLEQNLATGVAALKHVTKQIENARTSLRGPIEQAVRQLAQAEANYKVVK